MHLVGTCPQSSLPPDCVQVCLPSDDRFIGQQSVCLLLERPRQQRSYQVCTHQAHPSHTYCLQRQRPCRCCVSAPVCDRVVSLIVPTPAVFCHADNYVSASLSRHDLHRAVFHPFSTQCMGGESLFVLGAAWGTDRRAQRAKDQSRRKSE